jgi:hypothetical protein
MVREEVNGCHVKVWSMSIMGWRYHVSFPNGTTAADTKQSKRAAQMAARRVAKAATPEQLRSALDTDLADRESEKAT